MNGSIAKYFKSPKMEEEEQPPEEEQPEVPPEEQPEPGSSKQSVAYSKSEEDRRIAENMASVLKSLKKKRSHKCSKRRRNGEHHREHREDKHSQASPEAAAEVVPVVKSVDIRRRSPRKSSHEAKTPSKGLKEKPLPVVEDDVPKVTPPKDPPPEDPPKEGKENKKLNAFQLMMSSRGKAIGSNSPGKEATASPSAEESQQRDEKVKRKLKLEEWADRKGGGKRKLQEEAEEEFIAHQMNRRAKRLRKLIKNMEPEEEEEEERSAPNSPRKSTRRSQEASSPLPSSVQRLKVTGKKGRQRLSSADDSASQSSVKPVSLEETTPVKQEPKPDEFVSKLSSPLKKKDSLLGYFSKVGQGKDASSPEVTPVVENVPPKRGRPRRKPAAVIAVAPEKDLILDPIIVEELSEDAHASADTPTTGRPRRSCAGKVKDYAVFGGTSPDKDSSSAVAATTSTASGSGKRKKPIVTPLKIINVGSPQTMQVVKSPSVRQLSVDEPPGTPKSSARNVKLAPLFVKKRGVVEDPEKVRARQEFLRSGIPEKMRLEIEKQRCYEESILNESPVFPLVSHVQQLEVDLVEEERVAPSLEGSRVRLLPDSPGKGAIVTKEDEFEFGTMTDSDDLIVEDILTRLVDHGDPNSVYNYDLPEVSDVKTIVREWKQSYKHFPVFKCYKQYRAMYEEHVEEPLPPRPGAPRLDVSEDSIELVEPKYSFKNGELLFTEKYKPVNTEQILINCQPAVALKKFLSSWKEDRTNPYDSGDDFENGNSNSSSTSGAICNHMVLVGPPGCGKTSNVYAVAADMNFNVLELNASSRRKGKIILQELQEATQSHQVRRKDESVDIFKKALTAKGSKTKLRQLSTDSDGGTSGSKKLSLILIEDADIIFEQDDGFLAAINQLISTSKRPIVLTTTDSNCAHLARYISNNVIRYVAPGIAHVAKLLSILAIVERVHIDQGDLGRLYALNRKDLRKTLNELQFFIQSGGDRNGNGQLLEEEPEMRMETPTSTSSSIPHDDDASRQSGTSTPTETTSSRRHRALFRLFSRDQNRPQLIRSPVDFDNLWCNMERVLRTAPPPVAATTTGRKKKQKQKTGRDRKVDELTEMVFFYENVSVASLIQRDAKKEDRLVEHLEEEVAHELVERSWERWFEGGEANQKARDKRRSGVGVMSYDSLKKFDGDDRQTISSHIGISSLRTRSTYCDYEPLLRTICRCERERSRTERRGSRFYHYFRSHCFNAASLTMDHFDALAGRFEEASVQQQIPMANGATEFSDESR